MLEYKFPRVHCQIYLGVISIRTVYDIITLNDLTTGTSIQSEKDGINNRTLGVCWKGRRKASEKLSDSLIFTCG